MGRRTGADSVRAAGLTAAVAGGFVFCIRVGERALMQNLDANYRYSAQTAGALRVRLARKVFHPSAPRFPLLHVDVIWKCRAMYESRGVLGGAVLWCPASRTGGPS